MLLGFPQRGSDGAFRAGVPVDLWCTIPRRLIGLLDGFLFSALGAFSRSMGGGLGIVYIVYSLDRCISRV